MKEASQGHRQRLRERFAKGGIAALADYETLELLLTYGIPRKDTKQIAKDLIKRFKTITSVLQADPEQLKEVEGLGENATAFLRLVREINAYCLHEKIQRQSIVANRADVHEYLRFHFGARLQEYIAVVFLDSGNHVLSAEIAGEGTVNQCVAYPRAIFEKALKNGAASFIIAHNHPGGNRQASEADWQLTRRLHEIGRLLEIPLLDHIIICDNGVVTLREHSRWPG